MTIIPLPPDDAYSFALYEQLDFYSELQGFNTRKFDAEPYLFAFKNDQGDVLGGIQGGIIGGWLDIYSLYSTRAVKGVGTRLLDHVENYALARKCKGVKLVTYPFQAPDFYRKRGYSIYGEVPDLVNGYMIIYMKKEF